MRSGLRRGEGGLRSGGPDPSPVRARTTFHLSASTLSRLGHPLKETPKRRFPVDGWLSGMKDRRREERRQLANAKAVY